MARVWGLVLTVLIVSGEIFTSWKLMLWRSTHPPHIYINRVSQAALSFNRDVMSHLPKNCMVKYY